MTTLANKQGVCACGAAVPALRLSRLANGAAAAICSSDCRLLRMSRAALPQRQLPHAIAEGGAQHAGSEHAVVSGIVGGRPACH